MKKSIFTFIAFILLTGLVSGQNYFSTSNEAHGNKTPGQPGNRQGLECPPNTIYSHPVNFEVGFTSWTGAPYVVYDQLVSTPASQVQGITFFGIFEFTPGRTFLISFYQDNAGLPGTQIATYNTGFIAGTNTGQTLDAYYQIYNYSYSLPAPVTLSAGDWVSIVAIDGSDPWYWCSASGGNGCVYQEGVGTRCDYGDVAFCLVGSNNVPLSDWALYIGIGLILVFTAVRFRKLV